MAGIFVIVYVREGAWLKRCTLRYVWDILRGFCKPAKCTFRMYFVHQNNAELGRDGQCRGRGCWWRVVGSGVPPHDYIKRPLTDYGIKLLAENVYLRWLALIREAFGTPV